MGARRIRRDQRQYDMKMSRINNGHVKVAERERRFDRMKKLVSSAKFPYIPSIMSYLSAELGKPSHRITEAEVHEHFKKA